ncbi:MAG: alpha/beta fold hydrolase, partial [Bryobacteraceae bacterium]
FIGSCDAIKLMDHRELVSRIKMATLVIVGEHDPGTPVTAAQFLHKAIKGSEFVMIKDAAHLPNIQQAKMFNEALANFLNSH